MLDTNNHPQSSPPLRKFTTLTSPLYDVGFIRRLAAILYDLLLLFATLLIASLPWVISGIQQGQVGYMFYVAFIYVIIPLYYIGFWVYGGQTLGMKTWKIRVVNLEGHSIGWGRSSLRMACAILSIGVCGFGFIHALFDSRNRTWHDILSKSQLISVSPSADKNPVTRKE